MALSLWSVMWSPQLWLVTGLPDAVGGEGLGFGVALLKTLVALAVVCALAYVALRFGLRRLVGVGAGRTRYLKVVEHCALGAGYSLWLVEAGRSVLLLGSAQRGLTLIRELDHRELFGEVAGTSGTAGTED